MTSSQASSNRSCISFHILTFGCQMNQRDSGWLCAMLAQKGWQQTQLEKADWVFVNTCSVREKPEKKVLSTVRRIRQASPEARIAVLGCVAQQLGASLYSVDPAIALVAGTDSLSDIPQNLDLIIANPAEKPVLLDISVAYRERENVNEPLDSGQAFVNIMQGCNNYCSYCIVPYTRGPQKSRAKAAILAECQKRLDQGAVEITLLGQNVNAWSDGQLNFPDLLYIIAKLDGLARLRFVTPHPKDMDAATTECLGTLPNICPGLHLPLQSGSDRILKSMRRRHTRKEYLELVRSLRQARPDLGLTTDLIVGFPGETEADFEDTLEMMESCGYMASYSFCYSDRPGTRSALMPDKIDQEVKLERLARLQALQEKLTSAWLEARIGSQTEILVEKPSPRGCQGSWQGRDPYGICVHIPLSSPVPGELVKVRIVSAKKHCLTGEVCGS